MKKRELEKSRRTYHQPMNTGELRAKVSKDLAPIKDTYDIAYQAIQAVSELIAQLPSSERPVRDMRELAAALRDAAGVMVAMRSEGRETVSYTANTAKGGTAEPGGPGLPPPTTNRALAAPTHAPTADPDDPPVAV